MTYEIEADDEEFIAIADMDAWDEFWSMNDGEDGLGIDHDTALALARNCSLIVGGGAAATFRVGFVD